MLKKIVFVIYSLRGGGAERVVAQLSSELSLHVEVTVVQLCDLEPFYDIPESVKIVKYHGLNKGGLRYVRLFLYLRSKLVNEDPCIIYSFGEVISPFVVAVAKTARKKVVIANRAAPGVSLKGWRKLYFPFFYSLSDGVVVQTQRAVDMLSSYYRRCRWYVLENPITVPDVVPQDYDRENACVTVGYLGGEKNQADIVRAFSRAAPSNWELWVVGDGPDREKLVKLAESLGLNGRVKFLGAVKDVYSILMSAKVFCFASRTEGFPNALAEAMASGCACISYDCITGPSELISNNFSGALVSLGDLCAYSDELKSLVNNSDYRALLSGNARREIERLMPNKISQRFLEISRMVRS